MKSLRHALPLVIALIAVVGGIRPARAGTSTLMIDWNVYSFPDSCLGPALKQQGQTNFFVNTIPIPTFTVSVWGNGDGSAGGHHQAPFNSSLFRVGSNTIKFAAFNSGDTPWCNHVWDQVWFTGLSPPPQLLFDVLLD